MISLELEKLLAGRSVYWLAKETGIRWSTLAAMAAGKTQRLEIGNLDLICEALDCEPGDILVRTKKKRTGRARKRR